MSLLRQHSFLVVLVVVVLIKVVLIVDHARSAVQERLNYFGHIYFNEYLGALPALPWNLADVHRRCNTKRQTVNAPQHRSEMIQLKYA